MASNGLANGVATLTAPIPLQRFEYPGSLIVVEGVDGSGKSTQLQLLKDHLIEQGADVLFTEWNSSSLTAKAVRRGKRRLWLGHLSFVLLHVPEPARYGANSFQIWSTMARVGVMVSARSGCASEYRDSVTVPQCGPNAAGSNTNRPSRTTRFSSTRCSSTNGWMGVTSAPAQVARMCLKLVLKSLNAGRTAPCVRAASRPSRFQNPSTIFGDARTINTGGRLLK